MPDLAHLLSVLLAIAGGLAGRQTPCFRERPHLDASAVFRDLQDSADVPGTYGTCTIDGGVLRDGSGAEVAHVGCGLTAKGPGIRDRRGIEVGASGKDVIARVPAARDRIACYSWADKQTYCLFAEPDAEDLEQEGYVVRGTIGGDVVRGAAAIRFLGARTVAQIHLRGWCH